MQKLVYENYIPINQRDRAKAKVIEVAEKLNINPDNLMIVFFAESRVSTSIKNSIGCVGLIQFCPDSPGGSTKTIAGNTYKLSDIARMGYVEQIELCYKYWLPYKKWIVTVYDLYLATFYPYAFRKDDNYKFGSHVSDSMVKKIASQNPAISKGKDYIDKKVFNEYVKNHLLKAGVPENLIEQKSYLRIFQKFTSRNWLPISAFGVGLMLFGTTLYLVNFEKGK